jgi:hypothetical protein
MHLLMWLARVNSHLVDCWKWLTVLDGLCLLSATHQLVLPLQNPCSWHSWTLAQICQDWRSFWNFTLLANLPVTTSKMLTKDKWLLA